MLLLKQEITKKRQVDKDVRKIEFDTSDNDSGKIEVEAIWNCWSMQES